MLSIVNYGASDSENEISDEDETEVIQTHQTETELDELSRKTSTIRLPEPASHKPFIAEEDDEFLHKKEVPKIAPPAIKTKVKIMIPRLSDFKDDEDDIKIPKIQPVNKKTGLLSMLPKPSLSFAPAPRPSASNESKKVAPIRSQQTLTTEAPKKVGLIPYALMSHKPQTVDGRKSVKSKDQESDDDDDVPVGSFFTFDSKDDELPQVNEDEVKALVAKETARMEQRKRQHEETESLDPFESDQTDLSQQQEQQQVIDEEAMKTLLGGNKAKRSKLDNIQFIDLSAADVMPNRDEWLRKSLAGETSYQPTGNILDKVNCMKLFNHQSTTIFLFF